MKACLLVIDPQMDFCDGPANGALAIPGAYDDLTRLAHFIDADSPRLDSITVTLDSHHIFDIGHPAYWRTEDDEMPAPFTTVTSEDMRSGRLEPVEPSLFSRAHAYLERLQHVSGRYEHTIWPPHCIVGTPGHAVHPVLMDALNRWSIRHRRQIDFVMKGLNPHTEHYSAVKAEIPDPNDISTQENISLVTRLIQTDRIYVAGQALSHCVKSTVEDLVSSASVFGVDIAPKLTLLTNAMSPVPAIPGGPDFPAIGKAFLDEMTSLGATVAEIDV